MGTRQFVIILLVVFGLIAIWRLFTYVTIDHFDQISDSNMRHYAPSEQCLKFCIDTHSDPKLYGTWGALSNNIEKIQYLEPPVDGVAEWKDFDRNKWAEHCKTIDHSPSNLMQANFDAYGLKKLAQIKIIFTDGTESIVDQYTAPDIFGEEAHFFKDKKMCG